MQSLLRRSGRVSSLRAFLSSNGSLGETNAYATASGKPALEKEFLIYRWDPERNEKPKYQTYKVDLNR